MTPMRPRIILAALVTLAASTPACTDRPPTVAPTTATAGATTPTTTAPPAATTEPLEMHLQGAILVMGQRLPFAVWLHREGDGAKGLLQIPAQGARDLALSDIVIDDEHLAFAMTAINAAWNVTIDDEGDLDACSFTQGGHTFECELAPVTEAAYVAFSKPARPQTPKAPFPYDAIDVRVPNPAAGIELAGTLTVPAGDGPFPAVVLATGSGAQDRDETLFDHKPFLVIADHFARHGIATLRLDDRGVGGSGGDPKVATTDDFVGDALAAVEFVRTQARIDPKRVGVAGHSEGGIIAPVAAARDPKIAFVIMIAGPGVPGSEVLTRQVERLLRAQGKSDAEVGHAVEQERKILAVVAREMDATQQREQLRTLMASEPGIDPKVVDAQVEGLMTPWFRHFIRFDPRPDLRKVRVPLLALSGTLDLQVDTDQNLPEIGKTLKKAGNRKVELVRLEGLNHLMQHAKTGELAEYGTIEETVAPEVLERMTTFITATRSR